MLRRNLRGMIASFLFFILSGSTFGQITVNYPVKFMSWNILNFPNSNPTVDSALRFPEYRKVMQYVNPDLLVTMENTSATGAGWFLSNVMNSGQGHFAQGTYINGYDSDNAIYYNDSLFQFISNVPIITALRDISHYTLKFIATGDTIHIFAVHLKASQGFEINRRDEVLLLRNVTDAFPEGTNFLVAGDFNFYSSYEPGYTALLYDNGSNDGYFLDPINITGVWNNSFYARHHTQSTRLNSVGGGSTGGMNDRFDMILYSQAVALPDGIYYEPGTFNNIGNDGNHFDRSVNFGFNAAVPSNIATALYNCSDHLPVEMILKFGRTIGIDEINSTVSSFEVFPNPMTDHSVVRFNLLSPEELSLTICDLTGKVILTLPPAFFGNGENTIDLEPAADVSAGIYLLTLSGDNVLINRKINIFR
ncbi:MAG: T9SS type A sorting domain-containing protein [Bacteroidota bacterium]